MDFSLHTNKNRGQSLIEVLLALVIFATGIFVVGFLILDVGSSERRSFEETKAILYAKEGVEALRALRDADADTISAGTYGIRISPTTNTWELYGTSDTDPYGRFTRTVTVTDISPGMERDVKKIESRVTWSFRPGDTKTVTQTTYLTDWSQTQGEAGKLSIDTDTALFETTGGSNQVYIGGSFSATGGNNVNRVGRWNGASWDNFSGGVNNGVVQSIEIEPTGGGFYVGGTFTALNGRNYLARREGLSWLAAGPSTNLNCATPPCNVYAIHSLGDEDSDLYIGGTFTDAGNTSGDRMVRRTGPEGFYTWSNLGVGFANNAVRVFHYISSSNMYAAGDFTQSGASSRYRVARCNSSFCGSGWTTLGAGDTGFNDQVNALAYIASNDIYAGGAFTGPGPSGSGINRIARWNGSSWSQVGGGLDGPVHALAISGNDLYVGGSFTNAGGVANTANIARRDIVNNTWHALGGGLTGAVNTIKISGACVYVGGDFQNAEGIAHADRVAKWNGSAWQGVNSSTANDIENGSVYAIELPSSTPPDHTLANIFIENNSGSPGTIDKITAWWNNTEEAESVAINGSNRWSGFADSGEIMDISNYAIPNGASYEIEIVFGGPMTGISEIILKLTMDDGSTYYTLVEPTITGC